MKRLLMIAALATCCASALAAPSIGVNVTIGVPPPPERVEVIPVAQPGHVWVPGFWDWHAGRHVWVQGHWEPVRAGYAYEPANWVHVDDGWQLRHGGWRPGKKPHPHGCPPGQAKKGNC